MYVYDCVGIHVCVELAIFCTCLIPNYNVENSCHVSWGRHAMGALREEFCRPQCQDRAHR